VKSVIASDPVEKVFSHCWNCSASESAHL